MLVTCVQSLSNTRNLMFEFAASVVGLKFCITYSVLGTWDSVLGTRS